MLSHGPGWHTLPALSRLVADFRGQVVCARTLTHAQPPSFTPRSFSPPPPFRDNIKFSYGEKGSFFWGWGVLRRFFFSCVRTAPID